MSILKVNNPKNSRTSSFLLILFFLFSTSLSFAQPRVAADNTQRLDCIDPTLINPDVAIPSIFEPVCGCDGVSYPNWQTAQYHHGLTSWTDGACTDCGFEITLLSIEQDCNGATACFRIEGGQTPYTIILSNGDAPVNDPGDLRVCFSELNPGSYTLTVIDATGCAQELEFNIPVIDYYVEADITNVTCFGDADGAIDLLIPVGVPLLYRWAGPNGFSSNNEDIADLEAGMYHVKITYEDGSCYARATFEVTQPDELITTFRYTSDSCDDTVDGCLTVQGGTMPYRVWVFTSPDAAPVLPTDAPTYDTNGQAQVDGFDPRPDIVFPPDGTAYEICAEDIPAGTYLILVADENNCWTYLLITIPPANPLTVTFEVISEPCDDQVDACITLSGGTDPYRLWIYTCPFPVPVDPEPVFNNDGTVDVPGMVE